LSVAVVRAITEAALVCTTGVVATGEAVVVVVEVVVTAAEPSDAPVVPVAGVTVDGDDPYITKATPPTMTTAAMTSPAITLLFIKTWW
jgi:hypothetical protein